MKRILFHVAAMAYVASADFAVVTLNPADLIPSNLPTNSAELAAFESRLSQFSSLGESYASSVSADPKQSSLLSAIEAFAATRTDAPDVVTATTASTTYTTIPDWFKAMPTELQQEYFSYEDGVVSIYNSVVLATPTGAASRAGYPVPAAAAAALGVALAGAVMQ